MTKLVEEFLIESNVLAEALVKAGLVDGTFNGGNVASINAHYDEWNGLGTISIKVEKDISLKDIKNNCDSCAHTYEEKLSQDVEEDKNPKFVSPLEFVVNFLTHEGEKILAEDDIKKHLEKLKNTKGGW